ncbi:MAG: hypothetical protein DRQ48_01280 [Gammaproteobacteria bacterium]|nr:MAG: hypothetical protein DRQ58_02585 [Gammaproteobacteria bacterium]RKZ72114.1 MAG: hypothetical protein DRQ48_01280 [Gammaproteobacteria bacterium]
MCPYQVNISRSILFIVLTFVCSLTFAVTYKWVDEHGNTHYTQKAPAGGIESETINPPPAIDRSQAEEALESDQEILDRGRENREKQAEARQRAVDEKARQKKNCEIARARLRSLTYRPRVFFVQPDGTYVRADEVTRQAEIAKANAAIAEVCK